MDTATSVPDLEQGIARTPQSGFGALGDWMSEDPDSESFMYRKFARLSARNLLFLQNRVFKLEKQSIRLDKELCSADEDLRASMMRFERWEEKAKDKKSSEANRLRLASDLNVALREYCKSSTSSRVFFPQLNWLTLQCAPDEALALYSNIVNLPRPRRFQLDIFREWFKGSASGTSRNFPIVYGQAKTMLDDADDLVALRLPLEQDLLTRVAHKYWTYVNPFINVGSNTYSTTRYYHRRRLTRFTLIISTATVILEILAPVVTLYWVKASNARLGIICGFTIVFCLSLCFFTSARRGEIFAASAAYAAVMVVFVSGDLGAS